MPLKDIFCQEKAISNLQLAFAADKVAHAIIFAGQDGVGKFATAKEFAKLLLCKNHVERGDFNDNCGECASCRAFEAGSHPDFEHVYKELVKFTKDGKDKTTPVDFPIDVVREFLLDKVSSRPALSAKKVYVLTEAEKLNNESQNCLLKVLEEPPAYCCIILICTRPDKLLPTIRSRCQIIRFGPVAEEKIIEKLRGLGPEKSRGFPGLSPRNPRRISEGLDEKQAKFFARLADGSLGLACTYARLEQNEANLFQTKTELLETIAELDYKDTLNLADNCIRQSKAISSVWTEMEPGTSKTDIGRKSAKIIVQIVIGALHDAMMAGVTRQERLINFDQPEQIEKIARRFDPEQAAQKIVDCFRTLHWIESSVNEKLIFESFLLNLAETDKITPEL